MLPATDKLPDTLRLPVKTLPVAESCPAVKILPPVMLPVAMLLPVTDMLSARTAWNSAGGANAVPDIGIPDSVLLVLSKKMSSYK